MGKKYIIEILDDCPSEFKGIIVFGLTPANQISAEPIPVEDLTLYTEPDTEQVRSEAYQAGFEAGKMDAYVEYTKNITELKKEVHEAYQKGLSDAWECARKIANIPYNEGEKIFGMTGWHIIEKCPASEVITKIKEYEDGKQEIKVGDEVGYYGVADEHGNVCYSGVVLEIREDDYLVMEKTGKTYALKKKLVMSKTDRHFPEIDTVLEKMRGE